MRKLLLTLSILILIGCSTFKLSTHNYDPIYGPTGNEIEVGVINTQWELNRKLRDDFQFRYNFAEYAMNQPYSWYFNNRTLNRYNMWNPYSRFDMYANSNNFWMNWAFDYPFNNFNYNWRDPFGFNSMYGSNGYNNWGYGNSWYDPYNRRGNRYTWNNLYYNQPKNRNISYNRGRRGSSSVNPRSATAGNTLVNQQPASTIDRMVNKLREKNKEVRVYLSPNSVPTVIRRRNNNIQLTRTNNRRTIYNNNNSRSNQIRRQEVQRTSTPRRSSSNSSNTPTRSNNKSTSNNGRKQQ